MDLKLWNLIHKYFIYLNNAFGVKSQLNFLLETYEAKYVSYSYLHQYWIYVYCISYMYIAIVKVLFSKKFPYVDFM